MPIYAQLMEQIRWAISTGVLEAGEQLPTVRQLAVELKINPNTVARVYRELEQMGMIATQQGRGTFVLHNPERAPEKEHRAELKRLVRRIVNEASAYGFTPDQIANAILESVNQEED